ncbi:ATP synthase gamma chain [Frankliniella fusca]|uniref:ATP synthase gamma chain n=1 Tax=Frankliniella fusca TaxID=407009 RepID=A0AAE1LB55_9NEOP|nr:ATP synthase gamma chain [Frankliniella fusca]
MEINQAPDMEFIGEGLSSPSAAEFQVSQVVVNERTSPRLLKNKINPVQNMERIDEGLKSPSAAEFQIFKVGGRDHTSPRRPIKSKINPGPEMEPIDEGLESPSDSEFQVSQVVGRELTSPSTRLIINKINPAPDMEPIRVTPGSVNYELDQSTQTEADSDRANNNKIFSSSSHLSQLYEQNEKILRLLNDALVNQRRMLSYIVPESEQTKKDYQDLPQLPLTCEEDFDNFEDYLDLKSQKKLVVKYFISLFKQGMDEGKFVTKILSSIISNQLARAISWEGTEGTKIRFNASKINNAIRLAVLSLFDSSDLSRSEFKIQRWFNTSAKRT